MAKQEKSAAIASPDELSEYIHVTTPSVWLVLIAVLILVAGALFWASKAHLKTVAHGCAVVENGSAVVYFDIKYSNNIKEGMDVSINGTDYTIRSVDKETYIDDEAENSKLLSREFSHDSKVCSAVVPCDQPNSIYPADATVEVVTPISFLIKKRR